MREDIDHVLAMGRRSLRTHPGSLLLGSSGARLWADVLDPVPGFSGAIDFIHKMNIPQLFTVSCSALASFEPCQTEWRPSHLRMRFEDSRVRLAETKYITWDDCAVSHQEWTNKTSASLMLQLRIADYLSSVMPGSASGAAACADHNFSVRTLVLFGTRWSDSQIELRPGETVKLTIVASLGIEGESDVRELQARARRYLDGDAEETLRRHVKGYLAWFDRAPSFESNEALIDRTWAYRWFILRHSLAHPGHGYLQHEQFFEGRSHKMTKTPWHPSGWEFTKLIPLTVPMHLIDARWYTDDRPCLGTLRNLLAGQDDDGLYHCLYVDRQHSSYANFTGWAVWQLYLVRRNPELLTMVTPSLKRQISGWTREFGNSSDSLLIDRVHNRTGKEYQPSYWYFTGFPDDCKDPAGITPLKRVDRAVYFYLNVLGTAKLCETAGDEDAERLFAMARTISGDILSLMWDERSSFFYDLHCDTNERAFVKNIVGFYPWWAQITSEEHDSGILRLLGPDFDTPCPFPSVSTDCPVFRPEGGWKGSFIKGRDGCVWDGPTWPYTNSIVLDALANQSRRNGHLFDTDFGRYLREFSLLHFRGRDLDEPCLVEHYHGMTGEALSDEADYNHSYYIDLVVRHVAGVQIGMDRIVLDPIDIGLEYFALENLVVNQVPLRITYRRPGTAAAPADVPEGYTLAVEGRQVAHRGELGRLEYRFSRQ